MTEYAWMLVILTACGLAYDLLRRQVGNIPRPNAELMQAHIESLERSLSDHIKLWDGIGLQWREKVRELEHKVDRVTVDAKNEIAGTVAQVTDAVAKKGWR